LIEIFGSEADEYIHRISRFYPRYLFGYTQTQIESCKSSTGTGITKNTFFHIAKINGVKIVKGEVEIKQKKSKNRVDKFSLAEKFINDNYDIQFNTVSNNLEIRSKNSKKFIVLNENNLYVELIKKGITMAMHNLLALLKSDFVKKYDPIESYFKNLPAWDDHDYISDLCGFIKVKDQKQFNYHVKKWLVRLVATALEPKYFNKQILVFVSQVQNNGKSTLSRFFCPTELKDYLAENISLDKDSRIMLAKCILINMDELSTSSKEDITSLKAMHSKEQINERLPYDRKNTVLPRRCSFIGSTNQTEFLKDETGSARWLCFEVESIDWRYSKEVDINKIYAQAYSLYKSGTFNYEMTSIDIQENEIRNRQFYMSTIEKELIEKYFEADLANDSSNFYQATDVLSKLQDLEKRKFNLNNVKIGKALTALGHKRMKFNNKYGYFLKIKK
jgi:predicted P-loop ATPase